MRMRKLDRGQSVILLASAEVQRKILQSSADPCPGNRTISMSEVLKWCISQTWTQTKRDMPRWASQGLRYARHEIGLTDQRPEPWTEADVKRYICEPDARSLEDLYGTGVQEVSKTMDTLTMSEPSLREQALVASIDAKRSHFGINVRHTATMEEEQERELSPEVQQLRQVELPPDMEPLKHSLHADVRALFECGSLDLGSSAFSNAFDLFWETSARRHLEKKAWAKDLLVTQDFAKTVRNHGKEDTDLYLRPVHWVTCHILDGLATLVIVSPHEVNELLALQPWSKLVSLHVYSARTSESTAALDNLTFCAINNATVKAACCLTSAAQRLLQPKLNLFAGQTILSSHAEYVRVCQFLGLLYLDSAEAVDVVASINGWLEPSVRRRYENVMAETCPFQKEPLSFLKQLVNMRRDRKGFDKSHVGRLLHGEVLRQSVWDGTQPDVRHF